METLKNLYAVVSGSPLILFYLSGLVGMLGHYVKKWGRGEYKGNLWAYLFADNPRASLAAVVAYTAAAAMVMSSGRLSGLEIDVLVGLGFMTGYTVDSSVNSTGDKS